MLVLTVHREWESSYNRTTVLKDSEGKVKAIFSSSLRQPKRNQKTIVINCWTYSLNWELVAQKKTENKLD
jgi:hypothetical protein